MQPPTGPAPAEQQERRAPRGDEDELYRRHYRDLQRAVAHAVNAPRELIEDARKRPGIVSWGNVGAISINRIYAERLAKAAGVKFNMVPFKGGSESFQALIGRHLDVSGAAPEPAPSPPPHP